MDAFSENVIAGALTGIFLFCLIHLGPALTRTAEALEKIARERE